MAVDQPLLESPLQTTTATARTAARTAASPAIDPRTVVQIRVFTVVYWIAMYITHTSQMLVMSENEGPRTMAWRAGLTVISFSMSLAIGWVIRRTFHRPLLQRVLAIGGACLPAALLFALLGHIVWAEILGIAELPWGAAAAIAMQTQYNLLLFLLWSAFCAAILYSAQLQQRERSLLEAQALAHQAELQMLRYQINPHFLFNTLNAVSALIVTGQTQAADAMIDKLARFFRNALSRESTAKVTLAEDVRVQIEYLHIELTRFPDRLSWSTSIEPGLENALVPHLILQPLFENAIKHGVARSGSPVEICLTAVRREGTLIVTVANDVRPQSQDESSHDEPLGRPAGTGVGLSNVGRRLASFYGAEGQLTAARQGDRFVVELRMPLELTL